MASKNPFDYKPAQIAKSLIAVLTSVVGLLGVVASAFATGDLATVGHWATAAALFLTPILVFLQKAQPWMDLLGGGGSAGADRATAGD